MSDRLKRQLKRRLYTNTKFELKNVPFLFFVISVAFFFGTQLYINSMLSPLGGKLQSLNTEKDLLLQENRELEKDLANAQSITVVENLTNKKYKLKPSSTTQLVYITTSVSASK
ncbi:hypothetical protein IT417_01405 [bacterium]|nr:hypothetical protein [bacterium]